MKLFLAQLLVLFQVLFFGLLVIWPNLVTQHLFFVLVLSLGMSFLMYRSVADRYLPQFGVMLVGLIGLHGLWLVFGLSRLTAAILLLVLIVSSVWLNYFRPQIFKWFKHQNGIYLAVVLSLSYLLLTPDLSVHCNTALVTDFDSQNYLTWAYTAVKNYLPYKDLLYWYGLFSYYAASFAELRVIGVLWKVAIILATVVAANRFIKSKLLLSLFLVLFITLARMASGWAAFFRYGTAFALSVLSAYVLSQQVIRRWNLFLLGALGTVTMLLVSDQGIYFVMILAVQIFLRSFLTEKTLLKEKFINFIQFGSWCFAGFAVTWIIAATIMQQFGMLAGYWANIQAMGMLSLFAKVALSQMLFSKANIVTTLVLFLGTQLFMYEVFFNKAKKSWFIFLLHASWLLVLWLCQNKFLIRPWFENQYIFVSFALAALLISQLISRIKSQNLTETSKSLLLAASLLGLFAYLAPDRALRDSVIQIHAQYHGNYSQLLIPPGYTERSNQCVQQYFENFNSTAPARYLNVMNWIAAQPATTKSQVFSFPGEPVFYLLNQQQPPAYFNAYDATALSAQRENIAYLENKQVRYVIWDIDNLEIQDNVPNVLRNGLVAQYILTNFTAKKLIGSYLIFEKSTSLVDFLHDPLITTQKGFYESLIHQDLKLYPVLLNRTLSTKGRISLPEFTAATELSIPETLLEKTLYLKVSTQKNVPVTVEFLAGETEKADVIMTSCFEKKPCLIQLNQLPFFFTARTSFTVNIIADAPWRAQLQAQ